MITGPAWHDAFRRRPAGLKGPGFSRSNKVLGKSIINQLKNYPAHLVRGALVMHWASVNHVALTALGKGKVTGAFLDAAEPKTTEEIGKKLKDALPAMTLKDVERVFENLVGREKRKSLGSVYTPTFIADYLLKYAISTAWQNPKKLPCICDPACGSGGFLVRAAEILKRDYGASIEKAFAEGICGIDKDPWAVQHARCLIELFMASHGLSLPGPEPRLLNEDTLLSKPQELWDKTGFHQGLDVVSTNPPYVRLQNLDVEYRKQLLQRYPDLAVGSFSLALLFLVAGHRLLARGGCLAVITQNNLYTSLAGKNVRKYLHGRKCIRRIVDFSHYRVFPEVSAYTCLVFLGTEPSEGFEFKSLSGGVDSHHLDRLTFSIIRYTDMDRDKWRLAEQKHLANLERLESAGPPLGSAASIKVGFATLKDTVFFVRKRGNRYVAGPGSGPSHPIEKGITRPAVKIADLNAPGDLKQNDLRIIFPYTRSNGTFHLIAEETLKSDYPKAYAYLLACRDLLESRDKGRKTYENWYAWGRTQGMEAPGPKLLTKTFSARPQFFMDDTDQLFCNGYSVTPRKTGSRRTRLPIEGLQRILNSKIMHYYAKLTSFRIGGDYQCYQKNFIERFAVADMTEQEAKQLLELPEPEVDSFLAGLYGVSLKDIEEIV